MNTKWLLVGLALLVTCITTEAFAKREAPVPVAAVRLGEIEFSAPHESGGRLAPGYVEARDEASDMVIWRRQIYVIEYEPNMETDVQDVFVTELAADADRNVLKITNENGDRYELNLETLEVMAIKGSVLLRLGKRCRC